MEKMASGSSNSSETVIEQSNASNTALATTAIETSLSTRNIVRTILMILVVLFVVVVLGLLVYWLRALILLIVLAIFFAYLLAPLIDLVQSPAIKRNQARFMPRPLAIAIVYVGIFAGLWIAITYLLPLVNEQISQLTEQLPNYANQISERVRDLNRRYQRTPLPPTIREQIESSLGELSTTIGGYVTSTIGSLVLGLFSFLPYVILIPIFAFFFLKDAQLFRLAAVRALPKGPLRGRAELFFHDVNKTLAAYVRAQLTSCALIGVICTAAFYVLGVRFALLLGLLAAIFEFIPLIGPLIIGILATLAAGLESGRQALLVAGFLLVLRLAQDYVIYPRIVREGIHLHPLAIILAVLAGEQMAGIIGIFLSIPTVAILTVAYRHLLEMRGSDGIVSDLLDQGKTEKAIDVAGQKLDVIREEGRADLAEQRAKNQENEKNEKVARSDQTIETSGD